jgi:hypothetical protein
MDKLVAPALGADPSQVTDGIRLLKAFIQLTDVIDRKKVIDVAEKLTLGFDPKLAL